VRRTNFLGGIHPPDNKNHTESRPLETMPPPAQVILPLSQHLGKQARPLVKKGTEVLRGMLIAESDGTISAPIHAPVSGKVLSLGRQSSSSGFPQDAITIQSDPNSTESDFLPPLNPVDLLPEEIRERVRQAGIVGQGGAAFPTAVKLTPPEGKKIRMLILNGCECEPYLTRDSRLMIERTADVLSGLRLMMKAAGCARAVVGIEDNKPEAARCIQEALADDPLIKVILVKTRYPQGAEKLLIRAATGKEVPPGKLPLHMGIVVANVGTAAAVHDAVYKGMPSITAAITVSGSGIRQPKNLLVPVGTAIREVLEFCGGVTEGAARVVVGGPMMGVAQFDLDAPVLKATSGILVLTREEVKRSTETPCLKCGQCIDVCPMQLVPTRLVRLVQAKRYAEAGEMGITVCMECGTCAFTCPAHIPLVQWLRLGKQKANN
jgi:Na+-translocating ferredoxin:NAD+ oxidoreductase subunit C